MIFGDKTYSALIASSNTKTAEMLRGLLPCSEYSPVLTASTAGEARRASVGSAFDIAIINAPLTDEFGSELALELSGGSVCVLLLVKSDSADETAEKVSGGGVLTLPKPTSAQAITQALLLLRATRERLRRLEERYQTLEEKMEEIRIVNRAKWTLIEYLKMAEPEAHRYIEKQAMDMRISKRAAAEAIIRIYEK